MAAPKLALSQAQEAVYRVEEMLRAGHRPQGMSGTGPGAVAVAAAQAVTDGFVTTSGAFISRLTNARSNYGLVPDETLFQSYRYQQPIPKLQLLPARAPRTFTENAPARRVLVIPDRHNDPRQPHRLAATTWIARYGSEQRFDDVVCLGDALTMDSCSRHDKNDTMAGRHKPGIRDDMDNAEAMEHAFERGRDPDWKPKKLKARGNHEKRLFDFENEHPENEGTHTHRYSQTVLQAGWRERPFGEIFYIEGVGFTHAPMANGRARSGINAPRATAIDQCEPLVHGHTHQLQIHTSKKNGPTDKVMVIQAGCALPDGEVEHYATHGGATGWSYGVLDLRVCDGEITDFAWVSMRSLRSRYSDDGADVRAA